MTTENVENDLRLVFDKRIEKLRFYHFVANHSLLLICAVFHLIVHLALPNEPKKDSISWSITIHYLFLIFYCFLTLWLCCCKILTHERRRLSRLICIITGLIIPSVFWLENYYVIRSGGTPLAYRLGLTDCSYILTVIYLTYQFFNFNSIWRILFVTLISFLHYGYLTTLDFFDLREKIATILIFTAFDVLLYVGTFYQNYDRRRNLDDFEEAVNKKTNVEFEKERQDQLLLSIIPIYLADKVRKTILNRASKIRESIDYSGDQSKLFYDLHVQQHDNVSILFADIVKFTQLSVTLTPAELVRFLNELYTRFDTLAQEYQCMRIKILGDCYYCVSGIPYIQQNHADNCVKMGLAMIKEIKLLRENTCVDMDMRIGVHSGVVLCGIIGSIKWQYDIWSDDVTLANKMESDGQPGKVHITKATLQQLNGSYSVEQAPISESFLKAFGQETYFILPSKEVQNKLNERAATKQNKHRSSMNEQLDENGDFFNTEILTIKKSQTRTSLAERCCASTRNVSFGNSLPKFCLKSSKITDFWEASSPFSNLVRRRSSQHIRIQSIHFISNTLESQTVQGLTDSCFQKMIYNKYDRNYAAPGNGPNFDFSPILRNTDKEMERCYWDVVHAPFFKLGVAQFYLIFSLAVVRLLFTEFSCIHCLVIISTGIIVQLFCAGAITVRYVQNTLERIHPFESKWADFLYFKHYFVNLLSLSSGLILTLWIDELGIIAPLSQTFFLMLSVISNLSFVTKLSVGTGCLVTSLSSIFLIRRNDSMYDFVIEHDVHNFTTHFHESHLAFGGHILVNIFTVFVAIMASNWLREYENKMNFLCLKSFKGEHEDVETMRSVNEILLRNILPETVATHFLNQNRDPDALYYQRHENVCVMFASIPNFKTFWSEWDFSKKLECLRFLNEIVCDFDKFLQKPKFSGVEKIKTVGSTYMAAAGLRSRNSQESWRSAKLMVEFAWAITNSLDALNKDAFQSFQLRIGLSFGPVIAGVVAAQKPQYDIFGNTVNLASRMDTHGEMGKMHATEETADALAIAGFDLECRGLIRVKGVKDPMKTYFVIPPPDRKITSCESEIIHHD